MSQVFSFEVSLIRDMPDLVACMLGFVNSLKRLDFYALQIPYNLKKMVVVSIKADLVLDAIHRLTNKLLLKKQLNSVFLL